jgi:hypothetical protein
MMMMMTKRVGLVATEDVVLILWWLCSRRSGTLPRLSHIRCSYACTARLLADCCFGFDGLFSPWSFVNSVLSADGYWTAVLRKADARHG